MLDVDILVRSVEATRLSEELKEDPSVKYEVNASLSEAERKKGLLVLKFSMSVTSQPPIAKIDIGGSARIGGEDSEIDSALRVADEESAPEIFMTIYQRIYAILYLLSGPLKIPYPTPALVKTVKVASSKETPAVSADNPRESSLA